MEEMEKNENRIKDILEKTENDIKEGKITRKSGDSGEEFLFAGESGGLVFDKEVPPSAESPKEKEEECVKQEPLITYEKNAPRVEEVTVVSKSEDKVIKLDIPADANEFSVPTTFVVDEKYNTTFAGEERRSVYSTYVPKFTDASENYRMADQPRPPKKIPRPLSVDPTAEENKETEGAQVVAVGDTPASAEAILNVSKPAAAPVAPEKDAEPSVEREREMIESLLATDKAESVAEENLSPENVSESEPLQAEERVLSAEDYSIPDPDESTLRILDYPQDLGGSALPQTIENVAPPVQKKLFAPKEYQNIGQKMAFKDMFLDRLNSVAVRFGAALLLTLVLLVLENMHLVGLDAVSVLGLEQFPIAVALLDMQIVICLFLLAVPEIMGGIRALTKGLFHSELFVPILFVFQIIYTAAIMMDSHEKHLQYGFLFGLCAIATIAATYLRHRASFLTFRHVGGREEKLAVEKKMTRSLEKENFALDGAVDEYKSKTARTVRTSFIADFFARERKSAENTRHNLKYLLISFGIAFVAAVVMFFIGDGWISALSTLLITLYLSVPVALLLAHRLPFYISVRAASALGGGVIGETSHYDYAGVDVITFKDTEVFGKGAIALKHIILYDAAKEFTTVVEQMSSLFSVVGGPLGVLFSETLVNKCPHADEATLEEGGICGRIADVTFHVGDANYIASKGIALPREKDNREALDFATKEMYAAENGRVYAKFYVQYRLSPSYAEMLSSFAKEKIISLVYTRDPNVTNELMRYLAADRDLIRVIRDDTAEPDFGSQERMSVGLVSTEDKAAAVSLLLLCRRYVKMQKNLLRALWFVLGAGAFLGTMLSLFGLLSLPSAVYGIFQIALVGAMAFYTFKRLSKK